MLIRQFVTGDEGALREVFVSSVHSVARTHYSAAQCAAWAPHDYDAAQWSARLNRNRPFVAEIDNRPVGFANLQRDGMIDLFFVTGSAARQGVGTALMKTII